MSGLQRRCALPTACPSASRPALPCAPPPTPSLTRPPASPTPSSCDKELAKLQHQVDLKAERLRREVGAEEGAYQAQVAGLEAQWAAVRGGFGELEGRMTGVTQAATKIGNRLQVGGCAGWGGAVRGVGEAGKAGRKDGCGVGACRGVGGAVLRCWAPAPALRATHPPCHPATCRMPMCTGGGRWRPLSRSTVCRSLRMPATPQTSHPSSIARPAWERQR